MASNASTRLPAHVIATDRAILTAVSNLNDYAPMNAALSVAAVRQLEATLLAVLQNESRLRQEADVARDQAIMLINAFHGSIKGMRAQVVAQYGDDSVALHAVGLKKRSERKRPVRRSKGAV